MHDPDGFARRLDLALKARRIVKMYALAVALDIDESALSRWRRGRPISIENLVRLSRHLRISIDWLLTGAGSMDVAEPRAVGAWECEVVADLATLDPAIRERFADLMRRLADTRRIGCFEPHAQAPAPCVEVVPLSAGVGQASERLPDRRGGVHRAATRR